MKEHLTGSVDNLKLRFDSPHFAAQVLRELDGKRFSMEIEAEKRSVTYQQHKYYRSAVLTPIWLFHKGTGVRCSKNDIHKMLAGQFLTESLVNESTSVIIGEYVRSTADLTTIEMADYIDAVIQYAAELGIPIEEADKDWRLKKK